MKNVSSRASGPVFVNLESLDFRQLAVFWGLRRRFIIWPFERPMGEASDFDNSIKCRHHLANIKPHCLKENFTQLANSIYWSWFVGCAGNITNLVGTMI